MSLQAKTFLNMLAGALAGVLAWVLTDLTGWFQDVLDARHIVAFSFLSPVSSEHALKYLLYGAVFGALLGLLLGLVEAMFLDSGRRLPAIVGISAAIGFAGGGIGLLLGQTVYSYLVPNALTPDSGPFSDLRDMVGRALGWGFIGGVVGSVPGIASGSLRLVKQGAFGGLVGGLLGGLVFKAITQVFGVIPHVDILARLAALTCIGALVGFFVGLVQNLMKQAWIRVMLGKNEGKEYLIARQVTSIGRSELADIGLFGDPEIAPTHAIIEAIPENRRHRLRHIGGEDKRKSYYPTLVNGQIVPSEQWLVDGDTIMIGNRKLLFQEKATRAVKTAPAAQPGTPLSGETAAIGAAQTARPSFMAPSDVLSQMGDAPPVLQPSGSMVWPSAGSQTTLPPTPRFPSNAQPPFGNLDNYKPLKPETPYTLAPGPTGEEDFEANPALEPLTRGGVGTHFLAMRGPYSGQTFMLAHEPVIVGRAPGCDIPLTADTSVSRNHAMVTYETGRHMLADAGSSNGLYVDGILIDTPHTLAVGELVQIGETVLRYE